MKKLLFLGIVAIGVAAFFLASGSGPLGGESATRFDLTIFITSGGRVMEPGNVVEVGEGRTFSFDADTVVNLEASPVSGYSFVNWTSDFTVEFEEVGQGDGTETEWSLANERVLEDSETIYIDGVEQTRDTHYTIDHNAGVISFNNPPENAVSITTDYQYADPTAGGSVADVNAAETTILMDADYTITANFVDATATKILIIDSTDGGSVDTPGEGAFTYDTGAQVNLLAVPEEDCSFANWTSDDEDALAAVADVDVAETTITLNGDYSITANFNTTHTLTVSSTDGGSVSDPGEGDFSYAEGTVVSLTAEDGDDSEYEYLFVSWSGDVDTVADVNAAETTITLNGDYSITANFVRWGVRYEGDANDQAFAMTTDNDGNVYVTGWSEGDGTNYDYLTIKYDSDLNQVWAKSYNGPGNDRDKALAIAVDSSGNVFVTGQSEGSGTDYDCATVKYNSAGTQQWVARYDGAGGTDMATAIALDSSGNVYITGSSRTTYDLYATIKYNSAGTQQWATTYDSGDGSSKASAIAVDSSGNVYVTGQSFASGQNYDYATVKYNSGGTQQWASRYNGSADDADVARAIAVDSSGNVFVTGYSEGTGTENDYATIKYNSGGTEQWVARYDSAGDNDSASAIVVDGNAIYVTGSSKGSSTGYDYATLKYDTDGNQTWEKRYNGDASGNDYVQAMAVDSAGKVYVTGYSDIDSSDTVTNYDYAAIAYDSDGNELWTSAITYGNSTSSDDYGQAIAVDSDGNVYVTGYSEGSSTEDDYATIKVSLGAS